MKNFYSILISLFFSIVLFSCKEDEEDIILFPDESEFTIVESVSHENRESVSVYDNNIEVSLNVTLDSLQAVGQNDDLFTISLLDAMLEYDNGGGGIKTTTTIEQFKNSFIINTAELKEQQQYTLQLNFSITNVNNETEEFSKIYVFNTYAKPLFYSKKIKQRHFGEVTNGLYKIDYLKNPFIEYNMPTGGIFESEGNKFKTEYNISATYNNEAFDMQFAASDSSIYFYRKNDYILEKGRYELEFHIDYYELIKEEWIKTASFNEDYSLEIVPNEINYYQLINPWKNSIIDRNQNFNFKLRDLSVEIKGLFDHETAVIHKVEVNNEGNIVPTEIYTEGLNSRAILSDILKGYSNAEVKVYLKLRMKNDSIDYISSSYLDTLTLNYTVNDNIGSVITASDITESYPIARQRNFLIDEFDKGIMKFSHITGFEEYLNTNHTYKVIFKNITDSVAVNAVWNENDLSIKYNLPLSLTTNTVYEINLYSETYSTVLMKEHFKTSKYRTFGEKVNDNQSLVSGSRNRTDEGYFLLLVFKPFEIYDTFELTELIQMEGDIYNTEWYNQYIDQVLYQNYDSYPFKISWRDPQILGVPPTKAFRKVYYYSSKLANSEAHSFQIEEPEIQSWGVICNYDIVIRKDYNELKEKAINENSSNEAIQNLINSEYTTITKGNYPVNLKYTIPGYNIISSSFTFNVYNSI